MVLLINNLRIIQIFASPLADFSIELLNSTIDSTINSKCKLVDIWNFQNSFSLV